VVKTIDFWDITHVVLLKYADVSEVRTDSIIRVMEAINISEMSVYKTRLHGAISQKVIIFEVPLALTKVNMESLH
jgi:hypothetical protein